MNRKSWVLISVAILLGTVYIVFFTNMFKPKVMHIAEIERTGRIRFTLGHPYNLTSVRVVSVSAFESNKYALPVWELKSDSNSAPTEFFVYGGWIRGMHPAVKGARPEPLEHGAKYRLFVESGSLKAYQDFTP